MRDREIKKHKRILREVLTISGAIVMLVLMFFFVNLLSGNAVVDNDSLDEIKSDINEASQKTNLITSQNTLGTEINFDKELIEDESELENVEEGIVVEETIVQGKAEINNPVKWRKAVRLSEPTSDVVVKLPKNADNVVVNKGENSITGMSTANIKSKGVFEWLRGLFRFTGYSVVESSNEKNLVFDEFVDRIEVEYETQGPEVIEEIVDNKKRITVYSDIHYENILTYTYLDEEVEKENVKLYWLVNDSRLLVEDAEYKDTNNNNFIDYIEWITPSLSNQTYEVEIIIINVQSFPRVGGNWVVMFNTTGTANLTIKGINGTTFNHTEFDEPDLGFINLSCNGVIQNFDFIDNGIFIQNYNCDNITGLHTVKVLTSGVHIQEFTFGNKTVIAKNAAATCNDCATCDSAADTEGNVINVTQSFTNSSITAMCVDFGASNITIDCEGRRIDSNRSLAVFGSTGALENITIKNCVISGNQTAGSYGINFSGGTNLLIVDNVTARAFETGLALSRAGTGNVTIRNNDFSNATINGILLDGESSQEIRNISIINNNLSFVSGDSLIIRYSNEVNITPSNRFSFSRNGVNVSFRPIELNNLNFTNITNNLIIIAEASFVNISNITYRGNGSGTGIRFVSETNGFTGVRIENVTLTNFTDSILSDGNFDNSSIFGNELSYSKNCTALFGNAGDSRNLNISLNNFTFCENVGFFADNVNDLNISSNNNFTNSTIALELQGAGYDLKNFNFTNAFNNVTMKLVGNFYTNITNVTIVGYTPSVGTGIELQVENGAGNFRIENTTIERIRKGIDIAGAGIDNVTIRYSEIRNVTIGIDIFPTGGSGDVIDNITIYKNNITNASSVSLQSRNGNLLNISNTRFVSSLAPSRHIYLIAGLLTQNSTVEYNYFWGGNVSIDVQAINQNNNTFNSNNITNATVDGLLIFRSFNQTVINNIFENITKGLSSPVRGMRFVSTNDSKIINNTFRNVNISIFMHGFNNTIENNTIENNGYGINLNTSSGNNTIHNNSFYNNTLAILVGVKSTQNLVYFNNFTLSSDVHVEGSTSGNFFNITDNVGKGNIWDDILLLDIQDTNGDHWADSGSHYPYSPNFSTRIRGNVSDEAPYIIRPAGSASNPPNTRTATITNPEDQSTETTTTETTQESTSETNQETTSETTTETTQTTTEAPTLQPQQLSTEETTSNLENTLGPSLAASPSGIENIRCWTRRGLNRNDVGVLTNLFLMQNCPEFENATIERKIEVSVACNGLEVNSNSEARLRTGISENRPEFLVEVATTTLEKYCQWCYDGIKNYDEEGIDCGGSCKECEEEVQAPAGLYGLEDCSLFGYNYGEYYGLCWYYWILIFTMLLISLIFIFVFRYPIREEEKDIIKDVEEIIHIENKFKHLGEARKHIEEGKIEKAKEIIKKIK